MEAVSAREAEVLDLVGAGLTNAQIGARLFISVRTVESHVSALLRKLDLTDRRALASHATAAGGPDAERGLQGAPEPFTSFVGRRDDLDGLADALASARLVTLTGPGGIGKTRLALEAGRRHPAATKWFVDLVPAAPEQVIATIATALGVAERPSQSLDEAVHDAVGSSPALVVLDNCEHVLDAAAASTQRLLQACPEAVVLATSREVLGVPGERVVPVRPLALDGDDGAVALFATRARSAGASLDENDRDAIGEICKRVDGMPLAIELAAARCATLGVDGVLDALDDRFRLLAGARGADERHRSLRAVLDWSYDLLDEEEHVVLRRLSVFHGGFRLADAAGVACEGIGGTAAAADAVGRLAAKSLVVHGRGEHATSTYRLLETVRAYGADRLREAGESESVHGRHLEWAVATAGELEYRLERDDAVDPLLDLVFDDLRAALAWAGERGRHADAHLLARRLGHLAYARRFMSEAQLRYEQAAEHASDPGESARDLLDAGYVAFAMLRGDAGYASFLAAGERAEQAGDRSTAAHAYALAVERGNRFCAEFAVVPVRTALDDLLERARDLATGADARVTTQLAVSTAWISTMEAGTASDVAAEAAVAAAGVLGDPVIESSALDALAAARWSAGQLATSAQICWDRVTLLDRMAMHDPRAGAEQLDILHMASDAQLSRGDLPRALSFARDAVRHPLAAGALHVLHRELVVALCLTGRFDEAIEEAGSMRAVWERSGRPTAGWMAPATYLVALVHGLRGDRDEQHTWWMLGEEVCLAPDNAVRAFTTIRLALYEGRLADAAVEVERYRSAQSTIDSEFPWSVSSVGYEGYVWAIATEVWAARGEAGAGERIARMSETFADHLWARPCLERARARLTGDADALRAAATAFAGIDARFEEAATLAMLDGHEGTAGRAVLRALGCTEPAQPSTASGADSVLRSRTTG